jgi:hypothetical protein
LKSERKKYMFIWKTKLGILKLAKYQMILSTLALAKFFYHLFLELFNLFVVYASAISEVNYLLFTFDDSSQWVSFNVKSVNTFMF